VVVVVVARAVDRGADVGAGAAVGLEVALVELAAGVVVGALLRVVAGVAALLGIAAEVEARLADPVVEVVVGLAQLERAVLAVVGRRAVLGEVARRDDPPELVAEVGLARRLLGAARDRLLVLVVLFIVIDSCRVLVLLIV
jgi:hypothetical protein